MTKDYAIKFCKMYSDGWLPQSQDELKSLLKTPSINRFFESSLAASPWASGSWDNVSKKYSFNNNTIENVMWVTGKRKFRHEYIKIVISCMNRHFGPSSLIPQGQLSFQGSFREQSPLRER